MSPLVPFGSLDLQQATSAAILTRNSLSASDFTPSWSLNLCDCFFVFTESKHGNAESSNVATENKKPFLTK